MSYILTSLLFLCTAGGIILDPVYSGKALYHLNQIMSHKNSAFKPGQSVLFLHTGGVLGMYEKVDQLLPLRTDYPVEKLVVDKAYLM
jgi:D-cysteine desulfhydrase